MPPSSRRPTGRTPATPARGAAGAAASRSASPQRSGSRATAKPATRTRSGRRKFWNYPRKEYKGFHRWLPSWRIVVGSFLFVIFSVVGAAFAAYTLLDIPEPDQFVEAQRTTVYYADGTTAIGQFATQRREIVEFDTLPDVVGNAVVASEDRTFWDNSGVSITGTARALLNNLKGGARQGGSTITQQYVERYYEGTTKDYIGKAKEAVLALKITQTQSKEEILGRYLNTIYFGRDSYGIQVAAQSYFGKDAKDLTLSEAALLAGLIPSPNNWDPAVNPDKATQRWTSVLNNMLKDGAITQAERDAAVFPTTITYARSNVYAGVNGYILKQVRSELTDSGVFTDSEIDRGGLKIVTTIQQDVQDQAVRAVGDLWNGTLAGEVPNAAMKVGVVTVDPATGGVAAMYGGPDFLQDQFDRVTIDRVQAGSTFKPFTLIAALENGIPLSKTYNGNSPRTFDGFTKPVENFSNKSWGTIDLLTATANSVNTVYVELNLAVGPEKTVDAATRAGISAADLGTPVASTVLGVDYVHPLDMASAYATIASQGMYYKPHFVQEVRYLRDDSIAYSGTQVPERRFAADIMAETTYAMTQVVQRGSGEQWIKPLARPIAGKTGTSSENKSAWFVGFTPQLVTAVAFSQTGEDGSSQVQITPFGKSASGRPLEYVSGATWPAALWADYMGGVFSIARYATPMDFPARSNLGGPTATATPTAAATESAEPPPPPVESVAVPAGLEGALQADAIAALQAAGLDGTVVPAPSDTVEIGRVISTDHPAGETLPRGTSVALTVSTGKAVTVVPDPSATPTAPTP